MLENKTIARLATNQPHKIWVVTKKILDHLYFTYELSASIMSHKPINNVSNSIKTSKQRWTNGLTTANSDDARKKKTSKISANWKTTTSKDRQRFDFGLNIIVYKYYIQLGRSNVFTVLIVPVFFFNSINTVRPT